VKRFSTPRQQLWKSSPFEGKFCGWCVVALSAMSSDLGDNRLTLETSRRIDASEEILHTETAILKVSPFAVIVALSATSSDLGDQRRVAFQTSLM